MKKFVLIASSLLAVCGSAFALDDEGRYAGNGVTIELSYGARGATEFVSSKCPKQVFRPRYDERLDVYVGGDRDKQVFVIAQPDSTALIVSSNHKCMPDGTYTRQG